MARKSTIVDRTDYALKALKLSQAAHERHTLNQLIDMFKGSGAKKFANFQDLPFYGAGADLSKTEVERILQHMVTHQVFREDSVVNAMGFSSSYLKSGPKANDLLAGRMKINLTICTVDDDHDLARRSNLPTTGKTLSVSTGKKRKAIAEDEDEGEGDDLEFGHFDEYDLEDSFINDGSMESIKSIEEEEEDVYGSSEHELPPRQASPPPQLIKSLPQPYQSILNRDPMKLDSYPDLDREREKENSILNSRLTSKSSSIPSHGSCYEALLAWRDSLAMSRKVNASFIMSNSILGSIARSLPTCPKELAEIPGMTADRVQNYSEEILRICSRYIL